MFNLRRVFSIFALLAMVSGLPLNATAETVTTDDGTVIEKFGNWAGRCNTGPNNEEICHVFVDIRSAESETRVLYLGIGKQPGQGYFSLSIVPLGTLLTRGIDFKVDANEPFKAMLQACLPAGCQATTGLPAATIQQFKTGNELIVGITDIQQGPVEMKISLAGITAAINWLDTKHPN